MRELILSTLEVCIPKWHFPGTRNFPEKSGKFPVLSIQEHPLSGPDLVPAFGTALFLVSFIHDMQSFCLQQLFIAGLKNEIRAKVIDACKIKACDTCKCYLVWNKQLKRLLIHLICETMVGESKSPTSLIYLWKILPKMCCFLFILTVIRFKSLQIHLQQNV